ncbi:preprotein translocase subunit SecG [Acidihalobacter ferrooxydans]|uniref:Protein-export membrane protein SecG n=1 Tax=Acidihalobacter ferrooxydans TaxID=1765967 RepID=A0A1P8UJ51_9GAMM|nr:preprotein translocase subunit SecG [Acidihalobacter ferrooxydans]APZ43866.1 preprotein translocase subunit SecG [Acidihalobacter ferrooxydans]
MLYSLLIGLQVVVALAIIVLVLVQHGKGADAGAAFGSGASGTVFGSQGSGSFLSRATAVLAFVFFVNSLGLTYLSAHPSTGVSIINQPGAQQILDGKGTAPAPAGATTKAPAPASSTSDVPPAKSDVPPTKSDVPKP